MLEIGGQGDGFLEIRDGARVSCAGSSMGRTSHYLFGPSSGLVTVDGIGLSNMSSMGELDLSFWQQVLHIFSSLDIDYKKLWEASWEFLPSRTKESFHYTVVDREISWKLPVGCPGFGC